MCSRSVSETRVRAKLNGTDLQSLPEQMDPAYKPAEIETRQVYGVSLQQRRNDAKIDASLFSNIVTKNKEVRRSPVFLPHIAARKGHVQCPTPSLTLNLRSS